MPGKGPERPKQESLLLEGTENGSTSLKYFVLAGHLDANLISNDLAENCEVLG